MDPEGSISREIARRLVWFFEIRGAENTEHGVDVFVDGAIWRDSSIETLAFGLLNVRFPFRTPVRGRYLEAAKVGCGLNATAVVLKSEPELVRVDESTKEN